MRKGTEPAHETLEYIGLILVSFIMLYIIINFGTGGAQFQRGLEQGSLMYTIASSANALSSMEEGQIIRHLGSLFDITVECDNTCHVTTTPYDNLGKRQKESNEIPIIGNIKC